MDEVKPWWWPQEINADWYAQLRAHYPERVSGWSDERLLDFYGEGCTEFSDTWDHLGDARAEYEKLARAFLDLVSETGKSPADFVAVKEGFPLVHAMVLPTIIQAALQHHKREREQ